MKLRERLHKQAHGAPHNDTEALLTVNVEYSEKTHFLMFYTEVFVLFKVIVTKSFMNVFQTLPLAAASLALRSSDRFQRKVFLFRVKP